VLSSFYSVPTVRIIPGLWGPLDGSEVIVQLQISLQASHHQPSPFSRSMSKLSICAGEPSMR